MFIKMIIILSLFYFIICFVFRCLFISLTKAICRVVLISFKEVEISTKKATMMVEPSTRKAGVHVCSSATESGGGMEEKVEDDANDGDREDHDKNESKQLLILTYKQLSL